MYGFCIAVFIDVENFKVYFHPVFLFNPLAKHEEYEYHLHLPFLDWYLVFCFDSKLTHACQQFRFFIH